MSKKLLSIKKLLDIEVKNKHNLQNLLSYPDPLRVARKFEDDAIALICALFAYGNAKNIENFLLSLDFTLLENEERIKKELNSKYYRFQSIQDVKEIFVTISRITKEGGVKNIFLDEYKKDESITNSLKVLIEKFYKINSYRSTGYEFFFGKSPRGEFKSPCKRYHMFLRWMVRKDELDMGLWSEIDKSKLLMPLDVHTFNVSKKLGLIKRKTYDFKAVLELTDTLKTFDKDDPIKYDFALYRLGQSKEIENITL